MGNFARRKYQISQNGTVIFGMGKREKPVKVIAFLPRM